MALIKPAKEAINSFNCPELELWENIFILCMMEYLLQYKILPKYEKKRVQADFQAA